MKKKTTVAFLCVIIGLIILTINIQANKNTYQLYRVYLDGKTIGTIESKEKLEKYIDKQSKAIKEKYNVDNVYIPLGIEIVPFTTYDNTTLSIEEVYNIISEQKAFTIKGYTVSITGGEVEYTLNLLHKEDFETAINNVILNFIDEADYNKYKDGTFEDIESTGYYIEYIDLHNTIAITESYLSVDSLILTNPDEVSKYLLYGTLDEQNTYVAQRGDTIESIATAHQLNSKELLIANPQFTNESNLLFPGDVINVSLINPLFTLLVDKYMISDKTKYIETEIQYDATKLRTYEQVISEGEEGLDRVTERLRYENGQLVLTNNLNVQELKPMTKKVIVKGTRTSGGSSGSAGYNPGGTVIVLGDSDNWAQPALSTNRLTSPYGWRWGRMHEGIDFSGAGHGSAIFSVTGGTVIEANYSNKAAGNHVIIDHNNGYFTAYLHLSKIQVKVGEGVSRGQQIGTMGNTGRSTGTHLHFEVRSGSGNYWNKKTYNPCGFVRC